MIHGNRTEKETPLQDMNGPRMASYIIQETPEGLLSFPPRTIYNSLSYNSKINYKIRLNSDRFIGSIFSILFPSKNKVSDFIWGAS